ncbi:hypothetical protein GOP47_0019566 [Adiantum capillus-veneris]|uniref:Strictosidine synthase conserved region domain-containing protein n=1 Tax=Adiantum capillus-veneris TaxID=13818 RepID=A0A9D4Z9R0_ADICA|nr:hypothetical protein GOP47_0019566 [Adiantum capillus-veneris]
MGLWWRLAVVAVAAVGSFIAVDPWERSPIAGYPNFTAAPVPVRPFHLSRNFPRDHLNKLQDSQILFYNQLHGPESLTFDALGRGPYTGISDGRILRWDGPELGWIQFATIYSNGSENCKPQTPPAPNIAYEHECGRPLGIQFMKSTGELYIADSYFGLLVVGPDGGQAKQLVKEAEGSTFAFTNDLVISPEGLIYFTVSSDLYPRSRFLLTAFAGDRSGRLLSYDPRTREVKVLYRGLLTPNGITMSKDGSFLVFAETGQCRLNRFWLKGAEAGSMETFAELPGFPDNVRVNSKGQFWVAIYCRQSRTAWLLLRFPWLRRALVQLPLTFKQLNTIFLGSHPHALAIRLDQDGKILEVLEDQTGKTVKFISEIEERDGQLWMGSVLMPHIAVYSLL